MNYVVTHVADIVGFCLRVNCVWVTVNVEVFIYLQVIVIYIRI